MSGANREPRDIIAIKACIINLVDEIILASLNRPDEHLNLENKRDEYLSSFNSISMLDLIISLETEFHLILSDDEMVNIGQRSVDALAQFVSDRIKSRNDD